MTSATPVYLVTGAAGNLGRSTLAVLARRGASLVAADRGAAPADPGDTVWLVSADFFDPAACDALVASVIAPRPDRRRRPCRRRLCNGASR